MNETDDGMEPIGEAPEVAVPRGRALNGTIQQARALNSVPLAAAALEAGNARPSEPQIALWAALAAPPELRTTGNVPDDSARTHALGLQSNDRAEAFPALLAALLAERDHAQRKFAAFTQFRESAEDLIQRWRGHARYGSAADGERAMLDNAANDLFDAVARWERVDG